MSDIYAENISVAYDDKAIINNLSVTMTKQKITTIIGANGCGRSTLLKALTHIHTLKADQVFVDGEAIAHLPAKKIIKELVLLPQMSEATEGILVYELVLYGCFPYQNYSGSLSGTDKEETNWTMETTKVVEFANEKADSLSGGQRQHAWVAVALAQDTDTIFLDEPITYLDMNYQLETLEPLQKLNQGTQKTIIMVSHDLNLSTRSSGELTAMKAGAIKYHDKVQDIMTADILRNIFHIEAHIVQDPIHNRPILLTYQLT